MKRVGIVTHYHNSINYGGTLQAYALCRIIKSLGYNAEQIDFVNTEPNKMFGSNNKIKQIIKRIIKKLIKASGSENTKAEIYKNSFYNFNRNIIPHSDEVYDSKSISTTLEKYDIFITGSDQVWNPAAYNSIYGLEFVPKGIPKFSYAASLACDNLTQIQKSVFRNALKDYLGISLREKSSTELIEDLTDLCPEESLDPTLLLSKEEWDCISSDRLIDEPYIFAYFLGGAEGQKDLLQKFAADKSLKIVYISSNSQGDKSDDNEISLNNVSPKDYISLIKYSNYIFTDSFHACAFSCIYSKEFFVFNRGGKTNMNVRIYDLLKNFNCSYRFCDKAERETVDYIKGSEKMKKPQSFDDFEGLKTKSINYLKNMLGKAEKMIIENEN